MRVGLITDGIYPYVIGGMQKHSFYLAKYLSLNNVKVDLYHFKQHNFEKTKEEIFGEAADNIELITLQFPKSGKLPLHYLRESEEFSKKIYNSFLQRPLPDIIICKGFTALEFIRKKKENVKLPPVCINFHGYEMFQRSYSTREKIIQRFLKKPVAYISQNADYVFSYGGKITDIIKEKINVSSEKILEFPAGIEEKWLVQQTNKPGTEVKFIFVGRNEPRKGLKELNEVISRNLFKRAGWSFDFIGDVPENLRVHSDKIVYHGVITSQEKIMKLLSQADVLVCPSWSEGMPNVILEGMAAGLCILATDTGATRLLVNKKTGWLIENPEFEKLNSAFDHILTLTPEIIFEKKKNALDHIREEFLMNKISEKLINKLTLISAGAK